MACPAVITGDAFVTRILSHIDCQAGYLGSFGYQSLASPGSPAAVLVSSLLTILVALWGLRLLLGQPSPMRDVVIDALKVGIVLTLAFSWPAFRTVVSDTVLHAPAEIAGSLVTPGLAPTGAGFVERLQGVDDAIADFSELGTGRRSGQYIDEQAPGGSFEGTTLEDSSAFGWARLAWLVGLIGTLALVRICAGLLLALAPVAAGLLLFPATRGLFAGWARGLVFALTSAIGVTFALAMELAILEPWLRDALRVRSLGYATPAAPMELLAMTLSFGVVQVLLLGVLARVTFYRGWTDRFLPKGVRADEPVMPAWSDERTRPAPELSRVEALATSIETRIRSEREAGFSSRVPVMGPRDEGGSDGPAATVAEQSIGTPSASGFRRNVGARSLSASRRDRRR